jgi:hypothetical protein
MVDLRGGGRRRCVFILVEGHWSSGAWDAPPKCIKRASDRFQYFRDLPWLGVLQRDGRDGFAVALADKLQFILPLKFCSVFMIDIFRIRNLVRLGVGSWMDGMTFRRKRISEG